MKKTLQRLILFTILNLFLVCPGYSQAPTWVSNITYGSTANENARASCIDAAGNIYYTGTYSGAFSFGSVSLPGPVGTSDVFITKFNSSGVCQWATYIGSSSTDQIGGIVADANGVYVVGNFSTTATFGGTISKTVVGSSDAYVAKINPATGAFVWVNAFGCSASEAGSAICLDGSDGVYATGTFSGLAANTIASGPSSTIAITPTSGNTADVFVAKFSRTTGYCSWWSQTASSVAATGEIGKGICYTRKNIVVVGNYSGAATLGGISLPAPTSSDAFIARLDTTSGSWLSVQTASSSMATGTDVAVGCVYDTTTNATYITGYFGNGSASSGATTTITFGSTTLTSTGTTNIDDIFVVRYDHINNAFKWARNYGGANFERSQGLSVDNYGGIYVFGHHYNSSFTIGSTTLTNGAAPPTVKQSPLIFKITANDGTPLWAVDGAVSAGTSFANNPYGVVAYNSGATRSLAINGHYSTSLGFGSLSTINVAGGSSGDMFLAKLTDNNTCFTNINVEGNSQTIADEDITASATDHTDFGSIGIGTTVTRTYTIRNSGLTTLNVSGIAVSGTNSSLFTLGGLTLPATVATGATTTFTVTYSPVSAGTHNATITVNSNDCAEGTYNYSVKGIGTSASPLTATQGQVNLACNSICNGSATVTPGGGVIPYTYLWSTGAITASINGLCAGNYSCTITDNAGATVVKSFTLTEPSAVVANALSQTNIACNNGATGAASVSASGGTGSLTYNWTPGNPTGDGTAAISNIAAGTWTCTVTDANSCTAARIFTITQPSALGSSVIINDAACLNVSNGLAALSVTDGTPIYTYSWSPSGGTSATASNLAAGNYTATITDANGCIKTQAVTIGINSPSQTGGVAAIPGGGAVSQTQAVAVAGGVYTDGGCNFISAVQPYGGSPVSGNVTSKVWIENTVPVVGGTPYVARHYEITPAVNASTATGMATLYFLQSEFDAFNSAPGSVLDLPGGPLDLVAIANLRVSKFSGVSSDNSGLPASYGSGATIINPADIDIVWNATAGRWEVSFAVTGFSGFFVQTSTLTLPVSWVSFTAAKSNEKVVLTWQTAAETNSSHFVVEHSTDGRNFTAIGTVAAAGNSNSLHSYSFTHNSPGSKANFYRIMQIDNDGHKNYSDVRKINFDITANDFTILVNPVSNGKLQVQFSKSANAVIYNNAGQVVMKQFITAGSQVINLGNLAAGIYMLQSGTEAKKFIVE
jgi:hypothetical protein